jgi:SET domain
MSLGSITDPNSGIADIVTYHMYTVTVWEGGERTMIGDEHTELGWFTLETAASRYQFWLGSYLRLRHADLAVIQTERFGLIVLEDLYEAHTSPEPRSSRLLLQTTTIEYSRHRRLCHTRHSERTHGMNLINLNSYLNHSLTPSMRTRNGYDFITLRNISVGEELTVDYRTYGAEELVLVG